MTTIPITTELNAALPYFWGNELDYLSDLGTFLPDTANIVMLGIGPAFAACALLEGRGENHWNFVAYDIGLFPTAHQHLKAIDKEYAVTFALSDSADAADDWEAESVDLLIIDADHSYDGVVRDVVAWWSKLRAGGFVFFHDYKKSEHDAGNGVAEAIETLSDYFYWEEVDRPGISLVIRK